MKYRFLRWPGFRTKALTLSYDDGTVWDRQLVEIMNAHGIKGTFNLPGYCVEKPKEGGLSEEELRTLYFPNGHEVAVHGFQHMAPLISAPIDGIHEIYEGRRALEQFYHRIIRGMAYPDRVQTNETIKSYLRMLGIVYARSAGGEEGSFTIPEDWLCWMPTAHNTNPKMMEYADQFLAADPNTNYCARREALLFYLWGHSFEFRDNKWYVIEEFCEKMGGREEEIWYATNMEIYEYVTAYRSLVFSVDNTMVYNPSQLAVYFTANDKNYKVGPGETSYL